MITEESLEKFKKIYVDTYGIELEPDELLKTANNLLNLYRAVAESNLNININQNNEKKIQSSKN